VGGSATRGPMPPPNSPSTREAICSRVTRTEVGYRSSAGSPSAVVVPLQRRPAARDPVTAIYPLERSAPRPARTATCVPDRKRNRRSYRRSIRRRWYSKPSETTSPSGGPPIRRMGGPSSSPMTWDRVTTAFSASPEGLLRARRWT
jgi:hypothetical protein